MPIEKLSNDSVNLLLGVLVDEVEFGVSGNLEVVEAVMVVVRAIAMHGALEVKLELIDAPVTRHLLVRTA